MREIKFRAQRKDNSEWITGRYVFDRDRHYISPSIFIMEREIENEEDVEENGELPIFMDGLKLGMFHLVIPETVGQFTGLKDKNGVDIYEGDILKHFDHAEIIREVIFMKGSFGYWTGDEFISYASNYHFEWKDLCRSENIEILGNIHSNPELLNK